MTLNPSLPDESARNGNGGAKYPMASRSRLLRHLLVLAPVVFSLSACAPGRMALPPTLSKEAKVMPVVKTHKFWIFGLKKLEFGGYRVTDYNTGWQTGSGLGVESGSLGYDADKSKQKFQFKLTPSQGDGRTWMARCREAASKQTVSGKLFGGTLSADLERQATLDCTFQAEQGETPWTLALSLKGKGKGLLKDESLGGELSDGDRRFKVEGTNEMDGVAMSSDQATGFTILDGGRAMGAVQVINRPQVWMDPASETDLGVPMALASTALMLQKNLLKQLDDQE
jgi:hypothetical protein